MCYPQDMSLQFRESESRILVEKFLGNNMPERYTPPDVMKEAFGDERERDVFLDTEEGGKFAGAEFKKFSLDHLAKMRKPSQLGGDAFARVYFETESGNIYLVVNMLKDRMFSGREARMKDEELDAYERMFEKLSKIGGEFGLINGKANEGRGDITQIQLLSAEDDEKSLLEKGKPFRYGKGGMTTKVTRITAVSEKLYYEEYARDEIAKGRAVSSDVMVRLREMIKPKTSQRR